MASDGKTRKDAPKRASADERHDQGHVEPAGRGWASVPVPRPRLRMPGGVPGHVMWWGGLAALAAFGVVDWPVAAVVAAGTWVAEQQARHAQRAQTASSQ